MKSLPPQVSDVPTESDDPGDIAVLVVHVDDVVAALAATAQGRPTVLRVTPPFRRRQRARIHVPVESAGDDTASPADDSGGGPEPLAIPAEAFVDDDAPSFPRAPETEPAAPETADYDVEEHLERHEDAVTDWRHAVPHHFRDTVVHETDDGRRYEFEVRYLGD